VSRCPRARAFCQDLGMRRLACTLLALALLAVPAVASAKPRHYAGTGPKTLAAFRLAHPATLRWQQSGGLLGGLFALKLVNRRADIPNPQLVFSKSPNGTVRLAPGRYVLRVDGFAGTRWQLTIG
jgi:hypothetical protein